jgi:hypothetical protein
MGPAVLNKRISHHIEVNKKRHDMLMTRVRNLEEQVRKMEQSQPINQPASSCLPVGL